MVTWRLGNPFAIPFYLGKNPIMLKHVWGKTFVNVSDASIKCWQTCCCVSLCKCVLEPEGRRSPTINRTLTYRAHEGRQAVGNRIRSIVGSGYLWHCVVFFLVLPARRIAEFLFPPGRSIAILTRHADSCANWNDRLQFYLRISRFFVTSTSFGLPGDMTIKQQ